MRRLGVFALSTVLLLNKLWFIGLLIIAFNGAFDLAQVAAFGALFLLIWGVASEWRKALKRKIPPRNWTPPKTRRKKKKSNVPNIAEAAPNEVPAKPRRFAAIPMVEAIEPATQLTALSMSETMRSFIERGNHAIHTVTTPETEQAAPETSVPLASASSQPPVHASQQPMQRSKPPPMPPKQ